MSAKTVAGNDDPGFVAEIVCDDNVQTKTLYLKRATDSDANLQEVVIAGLPSSKFPCDVGWIPGTQPCERCPEGIFITLEKLPSFAIRYDIKQNIFRHKDNND